MNCLRYALSLASLVTVIAATAQENVHKTLDKWRYPEPQNSCTIKYTEDDYYLFIADSLKRPQEPQRPFKSERRQGGNGKEPDKEHHSSDKAATSFYLKEY